MNDQLKNAIVDRDRMIIQLKKDIEEGKEVEKEKEHTLNDVIALLTSATSDMMKVIKERDAFRDERDRLMERYD